MAHYVVADIHGEADRFHAMLEKIRFCADDTMYILGDVIDRGPDGIKLLQDIMERPNMVMLLGNHEYMMLQYFSPDTTSEQIRRWNRNGNAPTKQAYLKLKAKEQKAILEYLRTLPTHLEVTVNGRQFYLVHGFPAGNVHDEVWFRPEIDAPNPKPGYQVMWLSAFVSIGAQAPLPPSLREVGRRRRLGGSVLRRYDTPPATADAVPAPSERGPRLSPVCLLIKPDNLIR